MSTAGARIEVRDLTKRFGSFTAVDSLSFSVEPGRITGFLGPNGAGKTTTLRMLLGLVRPTAGTATIDGQRYIDIPRPQSVVGSALEATNFHPGRSGRDHLRVLADTAGVSTARVDEMLELVGIPAAARKRAGGYSMGMRQRLGLAAALLGDPHVLLLDEPANGLDPEGIRWLRQFLRHLSSQGRTVLVSSHMLSPRSSRPSTTSSSSPTAGWSRQGSMASLHGEQTSVVAHADRGRPGRRPGPGRPGRHRDRPAPRDRGRRRPRPDRRRGAQVGLPIHELRAHADRPRGALLRAHRRPREPQPQPGGWLRTGPAPAAHEGATL